MKKSILILISILCFGIFFTQAQEVNVNYSLALNGKIQPDSIYFFFFPTIEKEPGQRFPMNYNKFALHEKSGNFLIYPGTYTLSIMAFGYKTLNSKIYIPPNEDLNLDVILNPGIIGWGGITNFDLIKTVSIRCDHHLYNVSKEIPLTKKDKVWVLKEKPETLKECKRYTFFVNGQETIDLLNTEVEPLAHWLALKNKYTGNEMVFDPSLYSLVYKESELETSNMKMQKDFVEFVARFNNIEKEKEDKYRGLSNQSTTELLLEFDSIQSEYLKLRKEYVNFEQIVLNKQVQLVLLTSMFLRFPDENDKEYDKKLKEFCSSADMEKFINSNLNLLNQIDLKSFVLKTDFYHSLGIMQEFFDKCPELTNKHNLSENYFNDLKDVLIKDSPNTKLICTILLNEANSTSFNDEEKTLEILENLKTNYPYEKYIKQEEIDRILAKINIKLGKTAPDFSAELLNGETFTLSDYKGKYVFIDFWGSWCAPCLIELPHLKYLYSAIDRDKLEIIGLAQDKEESLRNCISKNEIEYPNALASKELLAKFGIRSFPSSFFINTEGMIVRVNIRGEDAMNLIKYEIENHFK